MRVVLGGNEGSLVGDSLGEILCCVGVMSPVFLTWNFPHFHFVVIICFSSQGIFRYELMEKEGKKMQEKDQSLV